MEICTEVESTFFNYLTDLMNRFPSEHAKKAENQKKFM